MGNGRHFLNWKFYFLNLLWTQKFRSKSLHCTSLYMQCTLYSIQPTLQLIQCTLYIIIYTVIHYIPYNLHKLIQCTLYIIIYAVYIIFHTTYISLYNVHCIQSLHQTVHCTYRVTMYIIDYTMYIINDQALRALRAHLLFQL